MTVTMKDIVTFSVPDEVIRQAQSIRAERDEIYGNIYTESKTDMRYVGDLGEIVINRAFEMCNKEGTVWHNQLDAAGDHDFDFCGLPIEVKTVKRRVPLRPHYKAQITARHMSKSADWLVFTSYEFPRKLLHIKGVMHIDDFREKAQYYGPGEQVHEDYTIRKGHEIYAIGIPDMMPFRDFIRKAMRGELSKK